MSNPPSPPTPIKKVLITGSAGTIGTAVVKELLTRGYTLRGLDLKPTPLLTDALVGPISDPALVDRTVSGMDAIIHLAATVDDADFMTNILPNNIIALHYVMEAAVRHKIKRIALASTMQTTMGLKNEERHRILTTRDSAPPNNYAVSKMFAEHLGHMYHLRHHIPVICARIGLLPRNTEGTRWLVLHPKPFNIYLSHNDAGRFFACCLEAPNVTYAVLWATSRNPGPGTFGYDLEPTKKAIGFEPQDVFPQGLPFRIWDPAVDTPTKK